jgi:ribosomal protein S27E
MTAYHAVVAERKDIAMVTILCDECEAEVSIAAAAGRVPVRCPSCGKDYTPNTLLALKAFGEFQRFATTAEEHAKKPVFRFSIKQPGEQG